MTVIDIGHYAQRQITAGRGAEHGDALRRIMAQHDPISLVNHLVSSGQRVVRAERIVRNEQVESCFFGKTQRLFDGARARRADHPASDQEQIGMIRWLFVDQLQYRAAHHFDAADDKVVILHVRNAVFSVLPPPVFQQLFRAHAGPALLDVHGLYQPFQHFVLQRHAAVPPLGYFLASTQIHGFLP